MNTMNEPGSMHGLNGALKPCAYPSMKTPTNEARYLPLLIGGVAIILLSTAGIAAVMSWMPGAADEENVVFALDRIPTSPATPVAAQAQTPSARAEGDAHLTVKCAECGVIASSREIEPFVVARVVAGKTTRSHEVTVHMKNGSSRVFMDATTANWRPGERVTFIEGASRSNN